MSDLELPLDAMSLDVLPAAARELLERTRSIVLDVREPWEIERVSVEGSYNVPLAELSAQVSRFSKDTVVLTLCHHGIRSRRAALLLREKGLRAWSILGGIDRWAIEVDRSLQRY